MANFAGKHKRTFVGVKLRPKAKATIARIQCALKRCGHRDSQGRAVEFALEYAQMAEDEGINTVIQVDTHRRPIT